MDKKKSPAPINNTGLLKQGEEKFALPSPSLKNKTKLPSKEICYRLPYSIVKQEGKRLTVAPVPCKSWDCDTCAPKRKKQLQFKARAGRPNRFITLTCNPSLLLSKDQQAQLLSRSWRNVRRRAKRAFPGNKIEFLAIFEQTQSGFPHLHILARSRYIPQKWLSNAMESLASAPIVDVRRVKNKRQAAKYVSKYIAKNPKRFIRTKRYWTSLAWHKKEPKATHNENGVPILWYLIRAPYPKAVQGLKQSAFSQETEECPMQLTWNQPNPPPIRPCHVKPIIWNPSDAAYSY